MISRDQLISQYGCTRCRARPGATCTGAKGQPRVSQHLARWAAAGITAEDLRRAAWGAGDAG